MDRLKELEVDLGDRRGQVKEVLAAAAKDKRALTADERETAARLTAEIDQITATIRARRAGPGLGPHRRPGHRSAGR